MVNNRRPGRKPSRHPGSGGVTGVAPAASQEAGEHYGIPARPYKHGASRVKLVQCAVCRAFMPSVHACPGEPVADA